MDTHFNFKSSVCTSREQSERLLALGLKKKTADMYMTPSWGGGKVIGYYAPDVVILDDHFDVLPNDLPAWSPHRLIELTERCFYIGNTQDGYNEVIETIEYLIKEGCFNKEYLENEMEEKM